MLCNCRRYYANPKNATWVREIGNGVTVLCNSHCAAEYDTQFSQKDYGDENPVGRHDPPSP